MPVAVIAPFRRGGSLWLIPLLFVAVSTVRGATLEAAFRRLYNFDFSGANRLIGDYKAEHPADPTGYWTSAASSLFRELDRLQILQGEFFKDDRQIGSRRALTADPATRSALFASLEQCREKAHAILAEHPQEVNALFALAIADGIESDYASLVEHRPREALRLAGDSQRYARAVMQVDPQFADAYLTTGISEYLIGSLPFFAKWFIHLDMVHGDKQRAVENLSLVADRGRYLGPFARILLAIIDLRERRPDQARMRLAHLAADFPENPLFRRELARLSTPSALSGTK